MPDAAADGLEHVYVNPIPSVVIRHYLVNCAGRPARGAGAWCGSSVVSVVSMSGFGAWLTVCRKSGGQQAGHGGDDGDVRDTAAQKQQPREREGVGVHHPLQAGGTEPESGPYRRQRDVHDRGVKEDGTLRQEISPADIYLLLANMRIQYPHADRVPQLRRRYLALVLAGLRAADDQPLPGRPPTWRDFQELWDIKE
jgi:hypothetical protein